MWGNVTPGSRRPVEFHCGNCGCPVYVPDGLMFNYNLNQWVPAERYICPNCGKPV